ncbi:MAG TPA: UvrD-helicase domain-containing protein [Acholeplasma sp.]|nr:UvrD-helicase domain-containing protein [Acholeplasma sp.]
MNDLLEKQLKDLNKEQLEAVKYQGSPLFVVAGAGTGKTKTLTMRIAYLVKELGVNPNNILGVTFTNKAAGEIRQRVNNIIYPFQMGSWLQTFHAFGLRILRNHAVDLKLGYNNDFNVIDEVESKALVKEVMDELKIDKEDIKLGEAKDFISSYKMELVDFYYDDSFYQIYKLYHEKLIKNQLMDFDDLIKYVYLLFKNNKEVLNIYQKQFHHILIDEFQDTDIIQYKIIKLLNNPHTFVVGDPDQSIYEFRGARYENNEAFLKDFKAQTIILNQNYRSTNNILKTANTLIKHNKNRTTEKDLKSDLGLGDPVSIATLDTDFEEVDYVAFEINKLLRKGLDYENIAVLYRNNVLSRNFEHKFMQYEIPYIIYGGISFYQRKEVKDILAYLKLVMDKDNNFFFKRIVNTPKRSLGDVTIKKLEEFSEEKNISMFEAIDKVNLPTRALNNLKDFKIIIETIETKIKDLDNIKEVVDLIYNESKYEQVLELETEEVRENRLDNINELKTVFSLSNNKLGTNYEKIKETLDELALFTDREVSYQNKNSVILSTVHQVKGLEFDAVFIVGLEDGIFPNRRASFDETKIDEERRLFYVAITRAKRYLYITNTERRRLYGRFEFARPSEFLNEIRRVEPKKSTPISKPIKNNEKFILSDIVIHSEFGRGIIVEIKGEILTIAFNMPHGIKKILATHPSIKKEDENEKV